MYDTQTGTFSTKEIIEFALIALGIVVMFGVVAYVILNLVLHKRKAKRVKNKKILNNLNKTRGRTILTIINSTSSGNWEDCKSRISDYLEHEFPDPDLTKVEFVDRQNVKDIYITLPNLENYHFRLEEGRELYVRK